MKRTKTYILASVGLAIALAASPALANKGKFSRKSSASNQVRSLQKSSAQPSTLKARSSNNLSKSSQAGKLQNAVKATNNNQFKNFNSKVANGLPKTANLNQAVTKIDANKRGTVLNSSGQGGKGTVFEKLNPSKVGVLTPIGQGTNVGNGTKVGSSIFDKVKVADRGNIGPIVGGVKDPGGKGPIVPIGPVGPTLPVDPKPPVGPKPPIGPIGPVGPIFPVDPKPPVGPIGPIGPIFPVDPTPPVNPNPPVNPCPPPTCPPYNPPCNPPYTGGKFPFPFPFPVGGGFGGGFCGTTTVVQPVHTPVQETVVQAVAQQPVQAAAEPIDLELVEVRQLDRGDMAQNLGPAYRVTLRNKSGAMVAQQFNVALAASLGRVPTADAAMAMTRVEGLAAGQMLEVDVRLPATAYNLGLNADGQPVPFAWLTAVVDSHLEVEQSDRDNSYATLNRGEIVMVAQQ